MANRDLNFTPTVNNVVPEDNSTPLETGVAQFAAQIADHSAQSKVFSNAAQLQVGYKKLDEQFRQKYIDDPTNAEGLKELADQKQSLADSLGENIPMLYGRKWDEKTTELGSASSIANETWTNQQQIKNTIANYKAGITTYVNQANESGRAFADSDGEAVGTFLDYATARQNLVSGMAPVLGKAQTDVTLKAFNSDYVKSFLAGVAERNPTKASKLLDSPEISDHFTTEEKGGMIDLINKVRKQQELQQSLGVTVNNSKLVELVNDPQVNYLDKINQIETLQMDGGITPTAASNAKRVLRSQNAIDSITDQPVMADLVKRVYDLNTISAENSTDYLKGIRNLQQEVLDKQATGQLTAPDAMKVNSTISTLTSKRMADATKDVGSSFYDANKTFDVLPPEYRAKATLDLFYASVDGGFDQTPPNATQEQKKASKDKYKQAAQTVMDNINATRRKRALEIVAATGKDTDLLRNVINPETQKPYTMEDVAQTAREVGISEADVMRKLRSKFMHKRPYKPVSSASDFGAADPSENQVVPNDPGITFEGIDQGAPE